MENNPRQHLQQQSKTQSLVSLKLQMQQILIILYSYNILEYNVKYNIMHSYSVNQQLIFHLFQCFRFTGTVTIEKMTLPASQQCSNNTSIHQLYDQQEYY